MRQEPFELGAWVNNPDKQCPQCWAMCVFAADVKAAGKKQIRVCVPCGAVFVNGKSFMALSPPKEED